MPRSGKTLHGPQGLCFALRRTVLRVSAVPVRAEYNSPYAMMRLTVAIPPIPLLLIPLLMCALAASARAPASSADLAPRLLDDSDEIDRYVDAFPTGQHRIIESPRQPLDCPLHGWVLCMRIWLQTPYIGQFYVEARQQDLIKSYMRSGYVWEPHNVAAIEAHIVPDSVALDLGAHMGTHALLMGRLVGAAGRVYAFEPQRKLFRELRHNIRLNGLEGTVTALRYALGARNDVVEMNPSEAQNEGGVGVGHGGDRVELRTLDSFGIENVSLLKIDVEGFEDAVLAGAAQTIHASKPVILIEILGGVNHLTASAEERERIDATISTIEQFGYQIELMQAIGPWQRHWRNRHDYIALPR